MKKLYSIIQRIIIHFTIILACFYINRHLLENNGKWDYLFAILFSGNALYLKDYEKWLFNL